MEADRQTALRLVTAVLNLAVAVLTGAAMSRLWLVRDASTWARARREPVRRLALAAAAVALAADLGLLWLESAAMAEVPVAQAAAATWSMLTATHFGLAWSIGMLGLVLGAAASLIRGDGHRGPALATLASLALYWYTRSMVSHAASQGDFSLSVLADWAHLGFVSLWLGEVMVAGGIILTNSGAMAAADRHARAAYVGALSSSAILALAGIVITGGYAAWRNLDGWESLAGTPYGKTLLAKLLLVGAAAALGGFNRLFVMPPWLAFESTGKAAPPRLPARFRRVLFIEALVLLAVLVLAAWLASSSPTGNQI